MVIIVAATQWKHISTIINPQEENPGGNVQCDTGEFGACAAGITACVDGELLCNQLFEPSQEVCDNVDNDCDDLIDDEDELAEGAGEAFPVDADGDGYGSPDKSVRLCEQTDGTVTNTDDCDDADAAH